MSDYDLLVRASLADGSPVSLAVAGGVIRAVGGEVAGSADCELDHSGDLLFPGWIDAHVHFNEPGRADWEGLATGSRALAAGGGTVFFDMPLNSTPPVLTAEALVEKRVLAEEKSRLDFALWGGLTPDSLPHLEEMARAGAVGFKAFMCPSGLEEFPFADAATLKQGMQTARECALPVAVHAEIDPKVRPSGHGMAAWTASRPRELELEAIAQALEIAGETGCALHIVHVSCAEGVELATCAKSRGVDVTVETCPHYLLLDAEDAVGIGAAAKCAPPLRTRETVEELRRCLREGRIDTVGSDHSPAPPELKEGENIFALWGGVAGVQHGFPLLLDEGLVAPPVFSQQVAQRFRLPRKGGLLPGNDADFVLVRRESSRFSAGELVTRHAISPYLGRLARHRVVATFLRGERVSDSTRGRFLRPSHL